LADNVRSENNPNGVPLKLFYGILEQMKTLEEDWTIVGQLMKFENAFKQFGLNELLKIVTDAIVNGFTWISNSKIDWLTYGICHVKQREKGKNEYILDEVCQIHEF
jgi:hypothetical protein